MTRAAWYAGSPATGTATSPCTTTITITHHPIPPAASSHTDPSSSQHAVHDHIFELSSSSSSGDGWVCAFSRPMFRAPKFSAISKVSAEKETDKRNCRSVDVYENSSPQREIKLRNDGEKYLISHCSMNEFEKNEGFERGICAPCAVNFDEPQEWTVNIPRHWCCATTLANILRRILPFVFAAIFCHSFFLLSFLVFSTRLTIYCLFFSANFFPSSFFIPFSLQFTLPFRVFSHFFPIALFRAVESNFFSS